MDNPLNKIFEIGKGDCIGEYKIEEKIGVGGSSIVFKVSKGTEIKAIKAIFLGKLESTSSTLGSEITIGMNICSNYLVSYYGVILKGIFQCIIMDYFPNGDLQTYLNKGNKLNKDDIIRLTYQIVSALKILHEKNIIHRDLKLQNIFVTEDKNFKLGDYGLSRKQSVSMTAGAGTQGFQAPEVLDGRKYSTSADMYSLGVILYILMSGRHPFVNEEGNFSLLRAASGKYTPIMNDEFGEELKELCYSLMKQKAEERPIPESVLKGCIFVVSVEEIIVRDEKIKEMRKDMETLKKENEILKKEKERVEKEKEEVIKEKEREKKEKEIALKKIDELKKQLENITKEKDKEKEKAVEEQITFISNGGRVEGRKIKFTKDRHWCTIFINKILNSGIVKMEVLCVDELRCDCFSIGVASQSMLEKVKDYHFNNYNSTCCIRGYKSNSNIWVGNSKSFSTGIPLPSNTRVALELNADGETLDFFVDGNQIPRRVKGIPKDVYFGFYSFYSSRSFEILSFSRLSQPTSQNHLVIYEEWWVV